MAQSGELPALHDLTPIGAVAAGAGVAGAGQNPPVGGHAGLPQPPDIHDVRTQPTSSATMCQRYLLL
jgi:hypothetical protein